LLVVDESQELYPLFQCRWDEMMAERQGWQK